MWLVNQNLTFNSNAGKTSVVKSIKNHDALYEEYKLTNKEIEVARLLLEEGITNEEIAKHIHRSRATVSSHLTGIFKKLNVQSRTEFMAKVLKTKDTNHTPDS